MKRPSSGPWFAPGMKMIGPKKPAAKAMPPVTSAPSITALANPGSVDNVCRQTKRAVMAPAASEARNEIHCDRPAAYTSAPPNQ